MVGPVGEVARWKTTYRHDCSPVSFLIKIKNLETMGLMKAQHWFPMMSNMTISDPVGAA
jgi:hypothetical protein